MATRTACLPQVAILPNMVPEEVITHQDESSGVRGQGHCQQLYQVGVIQLAVRMEQWGGGRSSSILHALMHHTSDKPKSYPMTTF